MKCIRKKQLTENAINFLINNYDLQKNEIIELSKSFNIFNNYFEIYTSSKLTSIIPFKIIDKKYNKSDLYDIASDLLILPTTNNININKFLSLINNKLDNDIFIHLPKKKNVMIIVQNLLKIL
jgi:hypothetical protein